MTYTRTPTRLHYPARLRAQVIRKIDIDVAGKATKLSNQGLTGILTITFEIAGTGYLKGHTLFPYFSEKRLAIPTSPFF